MSLLSLPRELLYLIFHSLSVDQVDKLARCSRGLYQLLTKEEYWCARAHMEGAHRRWGQLTPTTSWYELYHAYPTRVSVDQTDPSSIEEYREHYPGFILQHHNVAWAISGDLYLIDYYGVPQCNLTARGIRIRQEEDGSYAIIHSKGPYPDCGGGGSWIIYINEANELWIFIHYQVQKGEKVCHHLLARDVRTAGFNDDSAILFVVTLSEEFLFYRHRWTIEEEPSCGLYCCAEKTCNTEPIETDRFRRMHCPEGMTPVQVIGFRNRDYPACFIRTANNRCYYYDGMGSCEFVHEAEMLYPHAHGIIFYHSEFGWGYQHNEIGWNIERGFYPKLEEELILVQGVHFCHYRGHLFAAANLVNARARETSTLAIRYK